MYSETNRAVPRVKLRQSALSVPRTWASRVHGMLATFAAQSLACSFDEGARAYGERHCADRTCRVRVRHITVARPSGYVTADLSKSRTIVHPRKSCLGRVNEQSMAWLEMGCGHCGGVAANGDGRLVSGCLRKESKDELERLGSAVRSRSDLVINRNCSPQSSVAPCAW